MSQLNESPIITIERRKAVTIIISAIIVAIALGGGLTKVGSGFAARSANGIIVTGSAKVSAVADNVVWTLTVQAWTPKVAEAITKVGADVGTSVGAEGVVSVGAKVGAEVVVSVGAKVGAFVGIGVGELVGGGATTQIFD